MPKPLGDWLERHGSETRLALRTTLAALITFALAHLFRLPQGYWAVLTSVIVMQGSVGGSLKASIDRMIGTFAGAIWGVAVTLAIPHRGIPALALTLALALAPLALVAALRPSFRVAPVTAIIVLLSTSSVQEGPVPYAVDRVFEIGLGCIIGLAVSLFVLPGRAHGLLAGSAADVLRALTDLVETLLRDLAESPDRAVILEIHHRLRRAMARAETLAEEAKRERANRLTDEPDPDPVIRNLRRLHHDLTAVGRAVATPMPLQGRQHLAEPVAALRRAIADFLTGAARAFATRGSPPSLGPVDTALAAFAEAITAMRGSGALREQSGETVAQVYGLVFALQQLREDLRDLADRVAERATPARRADAKPADADA
ncbi:MAG TPA: FUSC family protein [Dongiaceae bacterium]|nr:FUSC family protein [Dongiaceae bacterium]